MRENIMGYWKLKDNLDPLECLQLSDNPLAEPEDFFTVLDFITWETKTNELNDSDKEHIYKMIKDGMQSGEVNDWDAP